jgi:hypothetical protein
MLVPHPLHVRVVEPTLLEWTEVEPGCSEPHRCLGGYEHLKRAIELAPTTTADSLLPRCRGAEIDSRFMVVRPENTQCGHFYEQPLTRQVSYGPSS